MSAGGYGRGSLRIRIVIPLMLIGATLLIAGTVYIHRNFTQLVDKQLHERAQVIGNALAYAAEITGPSPQLARLVNSLGAESDVLHITVVAGIPAQVIACTRNAWLNTRLENLPDAEQQAQLRQVLAQHVPFVQFDEVSGVARYNVPLRLSAGHDGSSAQAEGALHVVLDAKPTRSVLSSAARAEMITLVVAVVSISIAIYLLLDQLVLRPVNGIRDTMIRRAGGDLTAYAPVMHNDEIGELAASFNRMLDALTASEMRSRGILESVADGIITVDEVGRVQSFNSAGERIFGLARQNVIGQPVALLVGEHWQQLVLTLPPEDRAALRRSVEVVGHRSDGSTFPAELVVTGLDVPGRHLHNGIIRDITERKKAEAALLELNESLERRVEERTAELSQANLQLQAEITERKRAARELETLHVQLLSLSRQAGMAEVAAGVLHNVGNVLNSVTVAGSILTRRLRGSKVQNLVQVSDLLNAHADDLGHYLTHDEKGRKLPGYFSKLAHHLEEERTGLLAEVDQLVTHIDHIRRIINAQQTHARGVAMAETVVLSSLLEDVLRMNADALERHQVQIERDYAAIPAFSVDRHRLLQVLQNLVQNADAALMEGQSNPKWLRLSTAVSDGQVTISVADNGVGIPAERMVQIFSFGFTTRAGGHGFGLHSCALATKEMAGTLTVHSDGPEQGATFTLVIPFRPSSTLLKAS